MKPGYGTRHDADDAEDTVALKEEDTGPNAAVAPPARGRALKVRAERTEATGPRRVR